MELLRGDDTAPGETTATPRTDESGDREPSPGDDDNAPEPALTDLPELGAAVETWVSEKLGPVTLVADHSRRHENALVVELEGRRGRRWFLKHPRSRSSFKCEVRAYRKFLPHVGGFAPRLVAASVRYQALLMTAVPGRGAQHPDLCTDLDVHRRAGAWLSRLHRSSPPLPSHDAGRMQRERLMRLQHRVRDLLDQPTTDFIVGVSARLDELPPLDIVPCHLDFTQRNWLVDASGSVYVIDFSGCELAPAAQDMSRLAHRWWASRPDLRDAFLDGYGRELDDIDTEWLECSTVLTALSTLARGRVNRNLSMTASWQRTLHDLQEMAVRP